VCGKIYDRTEAQGAPLLCSNCALIFAKRPTASMTSGRRASCGEHARRAAGHFDPGGMARYIRGFLGIETGLAEYAIGAPRLRVQVDPALAREDSYRPFISCAVMRNVQLDHSTIKMVMNLQETCTGRSAATASWPRSACTTSTRSRATCSTMMRSIRTGCASCAGVLAKEPDSEMTPREILERHKTGRRTRTC